MELTETTAASELIFDGHILKLYHDTVDLPNGRQAKREIVRHPGGVCVLAVDDNGYILLVRQFRYPYGEVVTELPAGKLEPGEDPQVCAERELKEETGASGTLSHLATIYPTPGYTDELLYIYLATNLIYNEQSLDEDEFLSVERVHINTSIEMIMDGRLRDAKTVVGILKYAYRQKL